MCNAQCLISLTFQAVDSFKSFFFSFEFKMFIQNANLQYDKGIAGAQEISVGLGC